MQTETICDIRFKCRVLGSIEPAVTKFSERPADFEKFLETVGDNCFELFFANLLLARQRDGVANWLIQGLECEAYGRKEVNHLGQIVASSLVDPRHGFVPLMGQATA